MYSLGQPPENVIRGHATITDVTVRIGDIVIDCQDPRRAAEFWCAALGYRIVETDDTGTAMVGASSAPTLLFLTSTDRKLHKNRLLDQPATSDSVASRCLIPGPDDNS